MQHQVHAIIPARYASTRFPGKPLVLLHGKPMFWHVWSRAMRCRLLSSVTLATDDERIKAACDALAVPVVMTGEHQSGTDRVHEAALLLGLPANVVVINIQGDEPALDPEALTLLAGAFSDPLVQAATLAHPLDPADLMRPDKVKVVLAANGDALYFSRAGIPFSRDGERGALPAYGHIGLYAFTMQTLCRFVALPPSLLERTEKLEQLRLLENNIPMRVLLTDKAFIGVDQAKDVTRVLPLLQCPS